MGEAAFRIVGFRELERWDVKYFVGRIQSVYPLISLSEFITEHNEKIRPYENPEDTFKILGVNNTDGIFHAYDALGKEIKQPYKRVNTGDFAYNPYRINIGSIGWVPPEYNNAYISPAYVVFSVDSTVILPEVFGFILKSEFFNKTLRAATAGSVRMNLTYSLLETLRIPIPPLPAQQKIVAYWESAQYNTLVEKNKIEQIHNKSDVEFIKRIGISVPDAKRQKGHFVIPFSRNHRWDTFFFREDFIRLENQISSMDHIRLGDALNFVTRSWSPDDYEDGEFDYIEISSVNKSNGITTTKKIRVDDAPSRATTMVHTGDLIISTTRPYLGSFAIVDEKHDKCVCSSGFAVADSLKSEIVSKEFILFFLKSPAGLRQLERRMTGGLYPAIVQSELENILLPAPPTSIQKDIIRNYKAGKKEIAKLNSKIHANNESATRNIEKLILGELPIEAL